MSFYESFVAYFTPPREEKMPDEVKNLDQVKVGDQVPFEITEAEAMAMALEEIGGTWQGMAQQKAEK